MPIDLHTTTDVKKVREALYKAQEGIDPITAMKIPPNKAVLDHDHSTQFVRAVLHRQSNAVLGKIENLWKRYLGWWYTGTLAQFLRGCADYLDKEHPEEYTHPSWKKKITSLFNKLTAAQQNKVLKKHLGKEGKNPAERKKMLKELTADRKLGYYLLCKSIQEVQDE